MKLIRTYPPILSPIAELERELDRFFGRSTGNATTPLFGNGIAAPATDVREDDKQFVVLVELPGVKKDDVQVSLEDGVLTISGERKGESETTEGRFHRRERFVGRFGRSFELGVPVDSKAVKASFKDGVLSVTVPKAENVRTKSIEIAVE